ncbi:hypothetical protein VNI00_009530 [Paramarasmius palmivorus]|uniref:Carboxylic ester hydrolase n=1 Tax=Paramarasmius palmivorus TaxID=297713 RepID=A0AAW0CM67_9AGAR
MFALSLVTSLLLLSSSLAAPTIQPFPARSGDVWCQIPFLKHFIICPRAPVDGLSIQTPLGTAQGSFASGVNRFAVKYASADRWAPSTLVSSWQLPNNASDPTALPLACPQVNMDSSSYSEDCLSMMLYVPPNLNPGSKAPVMVWIHGGSFIVGSATGPGLDGARLAMTTGSIVAVIQYRLGALGFLAPDGSTNLGLKDAVNALQFLKDNISPFGGDASKITIAGQSSGANMVRALLAVPSAQSLFRSAILQSDPMNYGFLSTSVQQTLVNTFNSITSCSATDKACQSALSLDTIISAQMSVYSQGQALEPAAGLAQPIRVVKDGSFIASPLDSTATFPSVNKPVLISTVKNEAATQIYNFFPELPESAFQDAVLASLGEDRTTKIVQSTYYNAVPLSDGTVDARVQLEKLGTDQMWKCSSWTFARNWVQNGGKAFVGLYTVGSTYPGINAATSVCSQSGYVCHEGDIQIVFGTVPNPTQAQMALIAEVQMRYRSFLQNGNPNGPGLSQWNEASTTDVKPLNLGGVGGSILEGSCTPSFWGGSVQYDYQVYGL